MKAEREIRRSDAGFTLVELLIAVVILAVVAVPLMHAFLSSAKTNARAGNIAQATTAAQNLMEEIKARPLGEILQSSTEEVIMMDVLTGKAYKIYHYNAGDVIVNGTVYETDVLLDANFYTGDTADEKNDESTDYNRNEVPSLYDKNPALDASYVQPIGQDAKMAAEFGGNTSAVTAGMEREIILDITKNGSEKKVEISAAYTWNGSTRHVSAQKQCIYNNTSPGEELRNVYLYFQPMSYAGHVREAITIRNWNKVPVNIYLIRQGTVPEAEDGYLVDVRVLEDGRGAGDYDEVGKLKVITHLCTNLQEKTKTENGVTKYRQMRLMYGTSEGNYAAQQTVFTGAALKSCTAEELTGQQGLAAEAPEDRVYNVTVSVYEKGGKNNGKALVSFVGTKER